MSRILEIALRNSRENMLSEDFTPEQLFKRQRPENNMSQDVLEVPIEAKKETWEVISDDAKSLLRKKFKFLQPKHLLYFVNESLRKIEEMNHHPTMIIEKDTVVVETYTHDMNDVSSLDKDLAAYMDEIFQDIVYISEF